MRRVCRRRDAPTRSHVHRGHGKGAGTVRPRNVHDTVIGCCSSQRHNVGNRGGRRRKQQGVWSKIDRRRIAVRTIKTKLHLSGRKRRSRCQSKYKTLRRTGCNVRSCVRKPDDLIRGSIGGLKGKGGWHTGERGNTAARGSCLTYVDDRGKDGDRGIDLYGATAGQDSGDQWPTDHEGRTIQQN